MSWPNLRTDPDIFWVVLKKITKNPSLNNRTSNRALEARTHGLQSENLMVIKNLNKRGNVLIIVIFRRVRVTNVAVEKQ